MGRSPSAKHSIERINNNDGYSPDNCKWATRREQILNRRTSKIVTLNNETKPLADWCIELKKNYFSAYSSIYKRHGTPEKYFYGNKI